MRNAVFPYLETADGVYLVLHEGNERRDDNGGTFHDKGRQLVAQRLAAPGGHEHKRILAGNQVTDNTFLVSLKSIVTEESLQLCMQGGAVNHNALFCSTA